VNPVLAAKATRIAAQPKSVKGVRAPSNPHSMGEWVDGPSAHPCGDHECTATFYSRPKKSMDAGTVCAQREDGSYRTLGGENDGAQAEVVGWGTATVIDSMFHEQETPLCDFYEEQMDDAYKTGRDVLPARSKATDDEGVRNPIVLRPRGERSFYQDAFCQAPRKLFDELGSERQQTGLSDLYSKIEFVACIANAKRSFENLHRLAMNTGPELAMVDFSQGHSRTSIHPVTSSSTAVDARG